MSDKVVIIVEGGNVQAVYSDNPDAEVVIVDHDNLRENLSKEQRQKVEDEATEGLVPVSEEYPDAPH